MRLKDKVTVITGGGSGIGRETALLFAKEGANVVITDLNAEGAQKVCNDIKALGYEALNIPTDVTKNDDVVKMVAKVIDHYGRIDVLFNNAGIGCVGALHELDEEVWDQTMLVNIKGVYLVSRHVIPHMMQQRSGSIINMSSAIATTGLAIRAGYAASKGAIYSLTKSMQVDYAPYQIRVNALLPGTIFTPFVENYLKKSYSDIDLAMEGLKKRQLSGDLGTPQDVAYAALYLASDDAKFMMGAGMVIDGGLTAGK